MRNLTVKEREREKKTKQKKTAEGFLKGTLSGVGGEKNSLY